MTVNHSPARDTGAVDDNALGESWYLLVDPDWDSDDLDLDDIDDIDEQQPPIEVVIGYWPVSDDGTIRPYQENPRYRPATEQSATDAIDAVLRMIYTEDADAEHLLIVVRDAQFDLALAEDGNPMTAMSPDDVECVLVATGKSHQKRVPAADWQRVGIVELADLLPDDIDVLFNPDGPATSRVSGDFVRKTRILSDEEFNRIRDDVLTEIDLDGDGLFDYDDTVDGNDDFASGPADDEQADEAAEFGARGDEAEALASRA